MSDITCSCSMHGVHPGSFTFSIVDAYIYHEYLKKIFAVDAACVQRAVTLSRQWTQTASIAAERVKEKVPAGSENLECDHLLVKSLGTE